MLQQSLPDQQRLYQERYRLLFDLANDALIVLDLNGYITDINRTGHERLGYTREEMVGKAISEFDPPEFAKLVPQKFEDIQNSSGIVFESAHVHKNGSVMPVEVSARLINLDGTECVFSIVRDITERKRIQRDLELTHTAINKGKIPLFWISPEGQVTDVNESACRSLGYDRDELVGKYIWDFDPDYAPESRAEAWHRLKSAGVLTFETRHQRKDGTTFPVEVTANYASLDNQEISFSFAQDITEKRRAEEELRVAAKVFESHEAMLVTDADVRIIRVNEAFTNITGYSFEEAAGRGPRLLQSGIHPPSFYREMWERIGLEGSWQGEIWDKRKSGEIYPKWLTISSVKDKNGKVTHYVGSFNDITDYKDAQEKILHLALYDQLTGLPNRRLLLERLERALAVSNRSQKFGAVLYLDLDNFKIINDTQGHDIGDEVLKEIANRIRNTVRREDTVARLGGDEFVVLLEEISPNQKQAAAQAKVVGDKLLEVLAKPYQIRDKEYPGSVSIGVTMYSYSQAGINDLLKRSDMAMYEAKKGGRNVLRFFDPVMQETLERRTRLESDLRQALEQGQFQLFYQKRVTGDRRVVGAEVLLRWNHPQRGLLYPNEFIPLAEETGLIISIGRWVLEESCRQLQAWAADGDTKHLSLSVNISAREFKQIDFVDHARRILAQTKIDPSLLALEITESMLLDNIDDFVAKMKQLRGMGLSFALDDFGTGYSSLSYLKRLPISELKIDRSFVKELDVDKNDQAIVKTIIQMGKTLGMEVVAEGVETQEHREMLKQYGCTNYQGYLYGEPMSIDAFEKELD